MNFTEDFSGKMHGSCQKRQFAKDDEMTEAQQIF
jgi:hypothetical protein